MYQFVYRPKDEAANGARMVMATIALLAVFVGAVFGLKPAIAQIKGIMEYQKKQYKLVVIQPDNCEKCFDIYQVTDFIKGFLEINYKKVEELKASDETAKQYIKDYEIQMLPTFIMMGDMKAVDMGKAVEESSVGKKTDEVFVYKNKFPPFYNLVSSQVEGQFEITYLTDDTCTDCYAVRLHDLALQNLIMAPTSSSTYDISSAEGKKILRDYKIQYVPTIILRGDLNAYQNFPSLWATVGTIEKDGAYVFRENGLEFMGKYKNLWTGKVITPKGQ